MPKFAVMARAYRDEVGPRGPVRSNVGDLFMHDAASLDEAIGFGLRFARTVYPDRNGFAGHYATAVPDTAYLPPEPQWKVVE